MGRMSERQYGEPHARACQPQGRDGGRRRGGLVAGADAQDDTVPNAEGVEGEVHR